VKPSSLLNSTDPDENCFEYEIDFWGGDLPGNPRTGIPSPKECQKYCQKTQGCNFFKTSSDGDCYLKKTFGHKIACSDCASGPRDCGYNKWGPEQALTEKKLEKNEQTPVGTWCGYQENTIRSYSIIKYERLTISASNLGMGLDANTGIFTSPKSGVWLVSFSVVSTVRNKGNNWVWVYVNNKKLGHTEYRTKASNLSEGQFIASSGGRTLFLNLNRGDTVYLKTGIVADNVWHINTCFHFESIMM